MDILEDQKSFENEISEAILAVTRHKLHTDSSSTIEDVLTDGASSARLFCTIYRRNNNTRTIIKGIRLEQEDSGIYLTVTRVGRYPIDEST